MSAQTRKLLVACSWIRGRRGRNSRQGARADCVRHTCTYIHTYCLSFLSALSAATLNVKRGLHPFTHLAKAEGMPTQGMPSEATRNPCRWGPNVPSACPSMRTSSCTGDGRSYFSAFRRACSSWDSPASCSCLLHEYLDQCFQASTGHGRRAIAGDLRHRAHRVLCWKLGYPTHDYVACSIQRWGETHWAALVPHRTRGAGARAAHSPSH